MPNINPIKVVDDGKYPDFVIPAGFADKELFITTETSLLEGGWKLDLAHTLVVGGVPFDFDPSPDIVRVKIAPCQDIHSRRFSLVTKASRIREGGGAKPPQVLYKLRLEAGDEIIDQVYDFTSGIKNPVTFYSKITLKVQ